MNHLFSLGHLLRRPATFAVLAVGLLSAPALSLAQDQEMRTPQHPPPPGERGSDNITVLSHIPLGYQQSVSDIEIEQDLDRPFVYVARRMQTIGFDVIDISDPENAKVIKRWRIENPDLHQGGAMDGRYFSHDGRTYYVQSVQFQQGGPNTDVGAIVFDVTDLATGGDIQEVGRIRQPDTPGGFHNIFMYKHSSGKPLLFATSGTYAKVFDLDLFLKGDQSEMDAVTSDEETKFMIGRVPLAPTDNPWSQGYHDFYVGYHHESGQDRFYGAGGSGYYVFNVTDLKNPEIIATVLDVPGVAWGHTFTPSPDGRYAVGETEWQYQPLRIFDLQPALDGEVENIDHAISAWHADWKTLAHNHEVRWPYVFVSGYETGLSVFSLEDPHNPQTIAYYDTFDGPHNSRTARREGSPYTWGVYDGAWGVDVRNADGLIVVSDMTTGFWAFKMDGFDGWDGSKWGVPNVSSVQDWEKGPAGSP